MSSLGETENEDNGGRGDRICTPIYVVITLSVKVETVKETRPALCGRKRQMETEKGAQIGAPV